MNKPHKHADLIKAWANGAIIEFINPLTSEWEQAPNNRPNWSENCLYRVQPMQKKADKTFHCLAEPNGDVRWTINAANLKLTFDGETGKLKLAEVL